MHLPSRKKNKDIEISRQKHKGNYLEVRCGHALRVVVIQVFSPWSPKMLLEDLMNNKNSRVFLFMLANLHGSCFQANHKRRTKSLGDTQWVEAKFWQTSFSF